LSRGADHCIWNSGLRAQKTWFPFMRRAKPQKTDKQDGQQRLLRAAEELIRKGGPKDISVRDIAIAAGMNNASINYYFRSKVELLCELFRRHSAEGRLVRTQLLRDVLSGTVKLSFDEFVTVWYRRDNSNKFFALIYVLFADNYPELLPKVMAETHNAYTKLHIEVLKYYLPHLDEKTAAWRIYMIAGAQLLAYSRSSGPVLVNMSEGRSNPDDPDERMEQIIAFAIGAMKAPLPGDRSVGTAKQGEKRTRS
jgi:AcrR family transcriptional regulator